MLEWGEEFFGDCGVYVDVVIFDCNGDDVFIFDFMCRGVGDDFVVIGEFDCVG